MKLKKLEKKLKQAAKVRKLKAPKRLTKSILKEKPKKKMKNG